MSLCPAAGDVLGSARTDESVFSQASRLLLFGMFGALHPLLMPVFRQLARKVIGRSVRTITAP